MAGVGGVQFCDLFWKTLEPHRTGKYYPMMRAKLNEFIRRKQHSTDPVSSRDGRFKSTNQHLSGLWHFAICRNPDVVIFYTVDNNRLNLAMVGSHHDYPSDGKNLSAAPRTANRVRNAVAEPGSDTPKWPSLKWAEPCDLLAHPDLPELAAPALDGVLADLQVEMQTGARFLASRGYAVDDASEPEFERYLADLERATDLVLDIRAKGPSARYWLDTPPRQGADQVSAMAL